MTQDSSYMYKDMYMDTAESTEICGHCSAYLLLTRAATAALLPVVQPATVGLLPLMTPATATYPLCCTCMTLPLVCQGMACLCNAIAGGGLECLGSLNLDGNPGDANLVHKALTEQPA